MIKEIGHIAYTNAETFIKELSKNLEVHNNYIPEIQYQMTTLPNGRIQYSALILYK